MITIAKLEQIEKEFTGGTLKDLEAMLGFELQNGQDSTDNDTPDNMIDMYYRIEAQDKDGDTAQVTIFLTYDAELVEEEQEGKTYKVAIQDPNEWYINTARLTFMGIIKGVN